MGALRQRFWERPLADLNQSEWEALCDGCGRCCLHKVEYEDTGEIEETNVACTLLDCQTAQCKDYPNRKAKVPDCLRLTLKLVDKVPWLPETCAYRRRAEDRPLPRWHYLLSGDREAVIAAGVSVAGRVISEDEAGPLEHHIVEWGDGEDQWEEDAA
ncbi:YcgN family cysteine cluster protein [Qipengyuania sp. 1NDW9]|uniref:YcgN family cysteine cluster protein n=1 Tax=Qipengyuania xiapuensis TaxID=2867236 RepID=UPI001C887BD6|nr:YcgN family cysteine cluster protein [Qipengyuania xiapuensis]MBX7493799.1 YcgN family cysteine cluster protein [Qipengyuania xiapuensis]